MVVHRALLFSGLLCLAITVAGGTYVDNSGNVYATQSQSQASENDAYYNGGAVNQQSSNQGIQQAGNGDYAENDSDQAIEGRRLLGYYVDNSGNVHATQSQSQSSTNNAVGNSGPANQQSSNQGIQQAGNGNYADNYNKQTIKGRRLQGYYVDNSGNVHATQSQSQSSLNNAVGNSGPVNQQSSNQAIQQAGNGNSASNYNRQKIEGRRLLGDGYYIDNSGNVWATQSQSQSSTNDAEYNSGPVNQQSSNQAVQQAGNGNYASNSNKQTINGRRLQGYYVDNSGNVHATQSQSQSSSNNAVGNSGPVNQQSSNQAIQQAGNGNYASNGNKQTIKGRRLLGWYTINNSGDVTADQSQSQSSTNYAYGNSGPVNQQSSNQAIQQAGNGNSAGNYNKQTIKP